MKRHGKESPVIHGDKDEKVRTPRGPETGLGTLDVVKVSKGPFE